MDDGDSAALSDKELSATVYNNDTTVFKGERYTSLAEHFLYAETELAKTGVTRRIAMDGI